MYQLTETTDVGNIILIRANNHHFDNNTMQFDYNTTQIEFNISCGTVALMVTKKQSYDSAALSFIFNIEIFINLKKNLTNMKNHQHKVDFLHNKYEGVTKITIQLGTSGKNSKDQL